MSDSSDPRLGQIVDGRYQILEELGRGGMGCVYRAQHIGIHKAVALKLLASRLGKSSAVDRARFEREAFATGRLKHPNCVAVTDFGSLDDGTLYLAMELLEGRTLASALEACSAMTPARALHITKHILEGLAHAHEMGIVHRDLKSQNVMLVEHLGDPDFAKVLDFGLAKLLGEAEAAEGGGKLTAAGITFGTPHYISPEQAFGNPVDHRADLYAVSVMLFEMVAGRVPFDGPDVRSILLQHATRVVPRVRELVPEACIPGEVELIFRQGMAKDPRDRAPTARAYIAQVEAGLAALEGQPTTRLRTATPVPVPVPAPVAPVPDSSPPPEPASGMAMGTDLTAPLSTISPQQPSAVQSVAALEARPRTEASSARRWLLPLMLGGVAVVALIALLAGSVGDPDEAEAQPAAPAASAALLAATPTVPENHVLPAAAEAEPDLKRGELTALHAEIARARALPSRAAEKSLKSLRSRHPSSAAVAYALGRVYFDRPWPPEAIKAFRQAIRLEPSYRSDETIIKSAIRLLSSHSSRAAASRFLETEIGAPALPALDAIATSHSNKKVRRRAASIAAKLRAH